MRVDASEVKRIAKLASLRIENEEFADFTKHFNKVLAYFEQLSQLDTTGVIPTTHITLQHVNTEPGLRKDELRQSLPVEDVLKNASAHDQVNFRVPAIINPTT